MARMKKTEGGQGGKRGHSNMVHHEKTADIKKAANRHRRVEAKLIVQSDMATLLDSSDRRMQATSQEALQPLAPEQRGHTRSIAHHGGFSPDGSVPACPPPAAADGPSSQ